MGFLLAPRASLAPRELALVLFLAFASLASRSAAAQAKAHDRLDTAQVFQPSSVAAVEDRSGDGRRDLLLGGYQGQVHVLASTDTSVLLDLSAPSADELYGWSVSSAGDVDGDGAEDYVIGVPQAWHLGERRGGARIVSGATGATIRDVYGELADTMFGSLVLDAGDVDGDGLSDSIVGSDPGFQPDVLRQSSVYSGASGAELHSYTATGLRVCFAPAGDVDQDGRVDLLRPEIETPMPNGSTGKVSLISGADGRVLRVFHGAAGELDFGYLCGPAGDLDQDGVPDLLCGPRADATQTSNYAAILSGATGAELQRVTLSTLGSARAVALRDANGDGVVDYLLSSHVGLARVLSGTDGSPLFQIASDFYASSVVDAGDLNLDGRSDALIAGASIQSPSVYGWASYLSDCPRPSKFCTLPPSIDCQPYAFMSGGSSLTIGDPALLYAIGAHAGKPGFLIWNTSPVTAPFRGGAMCVSYKTAHVQPVGAPQEYPGFECFNSYSFVMPREYFVQHGLSAGDTIHAQFASPATGDSWLSEALRFTVCP